jgi:hypothetical protein
VKKFNFRLKDDVIGKLDELIDFFILFAKNSLLTVNVAFLLVFLVMVTNFIDLDVVFNFEFLYFLVNGDFEFLDNDVFDFLDFGHEVILNVILGVFFEDFRAF